jgi:hypothetical protein
MKEKEETLYPIVEKFLRDPKRGLDCFEVGQRRGNIDLGIADVIGVRHVGGDTSNSFEVVTVEVKKNTKSFGKKVGEALGYSLFAHRCYLAARGSFNSLQKQFAAQLGVGLIEVKAHRCDETLAAGSHQPNEHQMLDLLKRLHLGRCCVCGALKKAPRGHASRRASVAIHKKIPFFLHKTSYRSGRLVLCPECVQSIRVIGPPDEDSIQKLRGLTRSKKIWSLFKDIRKRAKNFGTDVEERPTKSRLGFATGKPFLFVHPKENFLRIGIPGRSQELKVRDKDDVQKVLRLAAKSYKRAAVSSAKS